MTLTTGTRLARYEILSLLGAGGMGEVYRARDTRLDRDVAIKVLSERFAQDPDVLARFQREGKAAAALSHANIRVIYDISSEQGTTFAVMELLEGDTLAARIKQGPLEWREAAEIGLAIANGLAAAHAKGIVHRDIKPANVFLDLSGDVKILDFGLARLKTKEPTPAQAQTDTYTLETQPGVVMGTVPYMSPEQVRSQPADARGDVFAFGCVLYEMITGHRAFGGATNADVMAAILHEQPLPLSGIGPNRPAAFDRVIVCCLEKDPAKRFASARELAAALRAIPLPSLLSERTPPPQAETVEYRESPAPTAAPRTTASVAVLPFVNLSSDKENEYFSDGLADELINALTKVEGLRVAPRTAAFAFKGKNDDIRKIGEQLNVRTVLEGSVRKAGNRLRINAQLVNVADSSHLWSESYNRQLEDVFAIQDEITQNIVKALRVILSEKEKQAIKVPTADVRAYEYYLRGRQFFHQMRRKGFEYARQMFARAIEVDSDYALAYAGLADCCSFVHFWWDPGESNLKEADAASRKALELGPELAETHTARGLALTQQKHYDAARQEFQTAIRLNPNLFEAYFFYARACFVEGKLEEAAQLYEQADRVRPEDYQSRLLAGGVLAGLGRQAEAEAAYRRGLQAAERHLELHPDDARALYLGAQALCQLGEAARSLEWAKRALVMEPEESQVLYNVTCVYALLGQTEEAIACLEKAIRHGFAHNRWIEHDSDLNSLRSNPRFQALVQRL